VGWFKTPVDEEGRVGGTLGIEQKYVQKRVKEKLKEEKIMHY